MKNKRNPTISYGKNENKEKKEEKERMTKNKGMME